MELAATISGTRLIMSHLQRMELADTLTLIPRARKVRCTLVLAHKFLRTFSRASQQPGCQQADGPALGLEADRAVESRVAELSRRPRRRSTWPLPSFLEAQSPQCRELLVAVLLEFRRAIEPFPDVNGNGLANLVVTHEEKTGHHDVSLTNNGEHSGLRLHLTFSHSEYARFRSR